MTLDDVVPLALSVLVLGCALILTVRRVMRNGFHSMLRRRYVLIDLVVLMALIEIVLDTVADALEHQSPEAHSIRFLAEVGRGAVTFGVLALLLTFPGDDGHTAVSPGETTKRLSSE